MVNRKTPNSILFLTTLGVYLGLVLVGATPQILAQAAMTRQFDVKDEIEVKDDLDKKPDDVAADPNDAVISEIDHKVARSVESFLAKFGSFDSINMLCALPEREYEISSLRWQSVSAVQPTNFETHVSIDQNIVVTNLPRAGLDALLAKDAK